jgi:ketosteroid isomerase-like protein
MPSNPKTKERIMRSFTDADEEAIKEEVKEQFNQLVSSINQSNASAWAEYYSKAGFLSAIAGTDRYAIRSEWVDIITDYFSMRESQHLEPIDVQVTALTLDLALMTSQEKAEMSLKGGNNIKCKHVFSMIWKKERNEWKILHSHESWVDE